MAGCGGCVNCGGKCSKKSGWTLVRYYIMYVVEIRDYSDAVASPMFIWKLFRKVKLLKSATNEVGAKIEAEKWLKKMRKRQDDSFKLKSAKLVASTHKNILELI